MTGSRMGGLFRLRLPSASSYVSGATQQNRVRGTVGRMLECGIKQEGMARAIKELQAGGGGSCHHEAIIKQEGMARAIKELHFEVVL